MSLCTQEKLWAIRFVEAASSQSEASSKDFKLIVCSSDVVFRTPPWPMPQNLPLEPLQLDKVRPLLVSYRLKLPAICHCVSTVRLKSSMLFQGSYLAIASWMFVFSSLFRSNPSLWDLIGVAERPATTGGKTKKCGMMFRMTRIPWR